MQQHILSLNSNFRLRVSVFLIGLFCLGIGVNWWQKHTDRDTATIVYHSLVQIDQQLNQLQQEAKRLQQQANFNQQLVAILSQLTPSQWLESRTQLNQAILAVNYAPKIQLGLQQIFQQTTLANFKLQLQQFKIQARLLQIEHNRQITEFNQQLGLLQHQASLIQQQINLIHTAKLRQLEQAKLAFIQKKIELTHRDLNQSLVVKLMEEVIEQANASN